MKVNAGQNQNKKLGGSQGQTNQNYPVIGSGVNFNRTPISNLTQDQKDRLLLQLLFLYEQSRRQNAFNNYGSINNQTIFDINNQFNRSFNQRNLYNRRTNFQGNTLLSFLSPRVRSINDYEKIEDKTETIRFTGDQSGRYIQNGDFIFFNGGTDRENRYVPPHAIHRNGTIRPLTLLQSSQAPKNSTLSKEQAILHLDLIKADNENEFERKGVIKSPTIKTQTGKYIVRDNGTVFFTGGTHTSITGFVMPPQTYINGFWYKGNINLK